VWRKWPARIEVRIEEHQAVAHWGDGEGELVNTFGEVFPASLSTSSAAAALRAKRVGGRGAAPPRGVCAAPEAHRSAAGTGGFVATPGLALKLEDGMLVELGREQAKAPIRMRLQRFVDYYPTLSETRHGRPMAVDMRYPNGFALRFPASAGQEVKGKK
jgi:cell division protein FtsQ